MKLFVVLSAVGTIVLMVMTYHPITVCSPASVKTSVSCEGSYYTATTSHTNFCRPSHQ